MGPIQSALNSTMNAAGSIVSTYQDTKKGKKPQMSINAQAYNTAMENMEDRKNMMIM